MNLKYLPAALLIATLASQTLVADTTGPNLNIGTSNTLAPSSSSGAVGGGNDLSNVTTSFFIGGGNISSSDSSAGSLVVGEENTIDSLYDGLTVGCGNYNSSGMDLVTGEYNTVSGDEAGIVVGDSNYIGGSHIIALGEGLVYESEEGFGAPPVTIIGSYNADVENAALVVAIGTGSDVSLRKNALEITQDGDVTIPKRQGDVGMGRFGNTGDE